MLDPQIIDRHLRRMAERLPKLEAPPITEVVCGVSFQSIRELDPLSLGSYWEERQTEYPRRQFLRPVVSRASTFEVSMSPDLGPIRTWLVSADDAHILQVQHDRFYLNWRVRDAEYPRFNDTESGSGLLSRFLKEVGSFRKFCERRFGSPLVLTGLELTKIDQLKQGVHWKDARDLGRLLPVVSGGLELQGDHPEVGVRISSPRVDGRAEIAIESLSAVAQPSVIQLQFRRSLREELSWERLGELFQKVNTELNDDMFQRVIPREEHVRFTRDWRLS